MPTPIASIRLLKAKVNDLKALGHKLAVETGTDLTWQMLVLELIASQLGEERDVQPDRGASLLGVG